MRLNLKKIWLVMLLPVLVSFLPVEALSALPPIDVRDPYIRRFLSLSLGYEVAKITTADNQSGESTESQRFHQTYDLSLIGNVVDPRLFVYSAGLTFSNAISSGTFTPESQYNSLTLSLQTILLRQLKFPLTLNFKRIMTSSDPGASTSTSDHYGLHWLLKFTRLPQTTLIAERNVDYPEKGSPIVSSSYQVEMSKKLWNTDNFLSHRISLSENSTANYTSYSNHARLARNTDMHTAAMFSQQSAEATGSSAESSMMGVSMNLSSTPSRYFHQSHGYTVYSSESDTGESTGQFFAGSFSFRPNSVLSASLNMNANKQDTNMTLIDEVTLLPVKNEFASESMSTGASLSYDITPRLSMVNSAAYSIDKSETSEVETGATETETMTVNSSLNYGRDLGWAGFSASYGLGYMQQTVKPAGEGSMLTNNIGVGLGGMNLRLFTFSTSASYSRNDNLSGNTWSNSRSLTGSLSNRFWQRYVSLSTSYGHSLSESWRPEDTTETNNLVFAANSNYFKRFPIGATHSIADRTTFEGGDSTSTHSTMHVSHGRALLGGGFQMKATYGMHTLTDNLVGTDTSYSTVTFDAIYKRLLLGRVGWTSAFSASKYTDSANERFAQRASLVNTLNYQLRSWSLSLVHKYLLLQGDFEGDFAESEILFKASRTMGWFI